MLGCGNANGLHEHSRRLPYDAVAKTVDMSIIVPNAATDLVIISALLSAIIWNLITILMEFPVRSSHKLFG